MHVMNGDDYFKSKGYIGFLVKKLTSKQAWKSAVSFFDKIRKYTFISTVLKVVSFIIALLEKSAVLLLIASTLLLLFPIALAGALIYFAICGIRYFYWNKRTQVFLSGIDKLTVFITKERVLSIKSTKLFTREAKSIAVTPKTPVIIVCSDAFIAAKWYSENILAVREDYFFVIKRKFIEKNQLISTFIVL